MRLLLDTNRYSDLVAGEPDVLGVIRRSQEVWIPFIVLGELRGGFASGNRQSANEQQLERFLAAPAVHVLLADEASSNWYGDLFSRLRGHGIRIPTNDIWIAALSIQHNLPIYSRDRHFQMVPGVQLV